LNTKIIDSTTQDEDKEIAVGVKGFKEKIAYNREEIKDFL